jgi:hypothetical protein
VGGNETVNTLVSVIHTRLWSSSETCGHHMLNVFPLRHTTVWNPSKLLCHSSLKALFFSYIFWFLLHLIPKITQLIWYKLIIY